MSDFLLRDGLDEWCFGCCGGWKSFGWLVGLLFRWKKKVVDGSFCLFLRYFIGISWELRDLFFLWREKFVVGGLWLILFWLSFEWGVVLGMNWFLICERFELGWVRGGIGMGRGWIGRGD